MAAPNLYPLNIVTADFADRAAALAAGFQETGSNAELGIGTTLTGFPSTMKYYRAINAQSGTVNIDFPDIAVSPGQVRSIGVHQMQDTGGVINHRLDIRWCDSSHTPIPGQTITGTSTPSATTGPVLTKRENLVAPANAAYLRVRFATLNGVGGTHSVAFGSLQMEEGATLSNEVVPPSGGGSADFGAQIWELGAWWPLEIVDEWGNPPTTVDTLRAEAEKPVNLADAAIQAGDYSSFTVVTTEAQLRDAAINGRWVRIPDGTFINVFSQIPYRGGFALVGGGVDGNGNPKSGVVKCYRSSGATGTTCFIPDRLTGGSGWYNAIVPSSDCYFGHFDFSIRADIVNPTTQGGSTGGNMLCIAGENLAIDALTSGLFDGGRYLVGVGKKVRLRRIKWVGGIRGDKDRDSGNGGSRIMGGEDIMCIDSHIESGDDNFQVVPAGAFNDPLYDISANNIYYIGGTGESSSARGLVCGLQDQNDDGRATMSGSITNVHYMDMDILAGGTAVALQNKSSSGQIADITYTRIKASRGPQAYGTYGQPGAVFLNNVTGDGLQGRGTDSMGGIRRIKYIDVEVRDHHRPGIYMNQPTPKSKIEDIEFIRGYYERSTLNNLPVATIDGMRTIMQEVILGRRGVTTTDAVLDNGTGSILDYVLA